MKPWIRVLFQVSLGVVLSAGWIGSEVHASTTPPAATLSKTSKNLRVAAGTCPAKRRRWGKLVHDTTPCVVYRVVDGDTVHVKCNGRKEKLRLVGIDTPETKHPFKPIEYYGPQASARAKTLLTKGMTVCLSYSRRTRSGAAPRGKYGRVLAYIFMTNGSMFNGRMIREGFAFALRRYPHPYMQRFISYENSAKRGNKGMWSDRGKVRALIASDNAYRNQRKACRRKYGRFSWVIGDTRTKHFYTRRHGWNYFRTNPSTRRLFCTEREAQDAGFTFAPKKRRSRRYRRRRYRRYPTYKRNGRMYLGNGRKSDGVLVLADPRTKTYRVFRGEFRVFPSIAEARKAGFKPGEIIGSKGYKRRHGAVIPKGNCRIVGNKRSKVFRTPGMKSYKRATRSKNAIYFCTVKQAIDKGYRKAKR